MGKVFYYDWHWKLQSSPEALWPYVSDTQNFNRVTGLPSLTFEEVAGQDNEVHRRFRGKLYGFFPMYGEESAFEWIKPQRFGVFRRYDYPLFPMKTMRVLTHLTPTREGGTDLRYEVWAEANGLFGLLSVPFGVGVQSRVLFGRAFKRMDAYVQGHQERPYVAPMVKISGDARQRFDRMMKELRAAKHDPALLVHFEYHLLNSPESQLARMRPYAFADKWTTDREATLKVFLHAAQIGLIDLSWDVLCPECRGAKAQVRRLYDLPETVHCPSCNIDYTADFERSVEATFTLGQAIAEIEHHDYCIGGPHATPHILMQQQLEANESRTTTLRLDPGIYRLRAPRLANREIVVPAALLTPLPNQPWLTASAGQAPELTVEMTPANLEAAPNQVGVGQVTVAMRNTTGREQLLVLEDGRWSNQAATAADITALQTFRDLFSSEALRPGYSIKIENLTILFTDLKGSTFLYRQLGDATAFAHVIDHFELLHEVVDVHRGAVVKTIGDAVMAVFRNPADAIRAALDMQNSVAAYTEVYPTRPLVLKIGLHSGPCIAVNLNDRLDYFGSTVNIAARVQGQSTGGDVVITGDYLNDSEVQKVLTERQIQPQAFRTALRGFEGDHQLYRISD